MEDIWFATRTDDYTFHVDAVKVRRRVRAPYRADGQPKDWEDTPDGKFRNTYPSNFWDDISVPYWSMPENTAHPTQKPEKLLAKLILASSDPGYIPFPPPLFHMEQFTSPRRRWGCARCTRCSRPSLPGGRWRARRCRSSAGWRGRWC